MSIKIRIRKVKEVPVLELGGDVTGEHIVKITSRLESLIKEHPGSVAVDLTNTTFIDSHGLGAFVYCWRLLHQDKRQLIFINPQTFIRNMFAGTNLDKIFKVVNSDEEL